MYVGNRVLGGSIQCVSKRRARDGAGRNTLQERMLHNPKSRKGDTVKMVVSTKRRAQPCRHITRTLGIKKHVSNWLYFLSDLVLEVLEKKGHY